MRVPLRFVTFVAGLLALGAPLASQAAPTAMPSAAATAPANTLTLYSKPGLRGRHATYRAAAVEIERQGFVARSAVSTGLWTLCEGGEVVSRCQTVGGYEYELRFAPQLVRPGLNALALYDQPGLKGQRIVYSFPADRPAPFHARSAQTWGGPWSLCERDFQHCQILDGKSASLDFVVGAVRPGPGAPQIQPPQATVAIPAKAEIRPAPRQAKVQPISAPVRHEPAPAKAPVLHITAQRPLRTASPPRLFPVVAPKKVAVPPRHLVIQLTDETRRRHRQDIRTHERGQPAPPARIVHRALLTPVHSQASSRRPQVMKRHSRDVRMVRDERPSRHAVRSRLVHVVSDHPARHAHAPKRRLYRHVRMLWGGSDPYLYDVRPRGSGSEPW